MTGIPSLFIKFKLESSENITFRDDMKAKTIGIGDIDKNGDTFIQNILLVHNLSYNSFSVNQLCDRYLYVLFKRREYLILDTNFNVVFKGKRYNDIYVIYLEKLMIVRLVS